MELFHRTYGKDSDRPLIILHGLFGISDNWDSLAREFAGAGFRVIVPDQRNHGRSGRAGVHSYEAMSDDLLELMDAMGIEQTSILGHSMGGKTAMQFAFDYPEKMQRLIVADISPAASRNTQHNDLIELMMQVPLEQYQSRAEVDEFLHDKIQSRRIRQFLLKNIYRKDKSSLGWRVNLPVIKESLPEIFRALNAYVPFEKPALFLRGELSPYIADEDVSVIGTLFTNYRLVTIKDGTHWLHADNPGDFAGAVLDFLS